MAVNGTPDGHLSCHSCFNLGQISGSVMSSCPAGVPLIAVNPFQDVAELYDSKMVNRYKSGSAVEIKVWEPTLRCTNNFILMSVKPFILYSVTCSCWMNLSCFVPYRFYRSILLIYLLLARKPSATWKEILKQGISRLLWVVKVEQERSVTGEVVEVKNAQL